MRFRAKRVIEIIAVLLILGGFLLLTTKIEPEVIVDLVGIQNIYFIVFIFATIGGVSFLSAASFYATLATVAAGGANPFLLALISAPGILIGDYLFWFLGEKGKKYLHGRHGINLSRFSDWLISKKKWQVAMFIYVYTGFTPLPGDLLMLSLALSGYRFKDIFLPTMLGNLTLTLIVSITASKGLAIFQYLF